MMRDALLFAASFALGALIGCALLSIALNMAAYVLLDA